MRRTRRTQAQPSNIQKNAQLAAAPSPPPRTPLASLDVQTLRPSSTYNSASVFNVTPIQQSYFARGRVETPPGTSAYHASLARNRDRTETPAGSSATHAALARGRNDRDDTIVKEREEIQKQIETPPLPSQQEEEEEEKRIATPPPPLFQDEEEEEEETPVPVLPKERQQAEVEETVQKENIQRDIPHLGRPRLSLTPTLRHGAKAVATYSRKRRAVGVSVELPSVRELGVQVGSGSSNNDSNSEWEVSSAEEEEEEEEEVVEKKKVKRKDTELDAFVKEQRSFWNMVDECVLEEQFEL